MKKFLIVSLLAVLVMVLAPSAVSADSYDGVNLIIDTPWDPNLANPMGTLEQAAINTGAVIPFTIATVTITANDTLSSADIAYINTMDGIVIFTASSAVTFDANNDTTLGDMGASFLANNALLVSVDIPNAINFGDSAFAYDDLLATVDLPNAQTFGDLAFEENNSLIAIELPSATTFGDMAFIVSIGLTTLELPSATSFGVFTVSGCTSLSDITLGSTVPTVTSFGVGVPIPGAEIHVPYGSATTYDNELSGGPGEVAGDGLWRDWVIVEAAAPVAVNPQTGDTASNMMYVYILAGVMTLAAAGFVFKRKAVAN